MRDYKFRVWSGLRNEMSKPFELLDIYTETENDYNQYTTIDKEFEVGFLKEVIMQYTGLKDKNSIDIYEGDILRIDNGTAKFLVEYKNNKFTTNYFKNNFWKDAIIIGNIYQNPEMLK